jgi:hypothetical protein
VSIDLREASSADSRKAKGAESSDLRRAQQRLTSQAFNPPRIIQTTREKAPPAPVKDGLVAGCLGPSPGVSPERPGVQPKGER